MIVLSNFQLKELDDVDIVLDLGLSVMWLVFVFIASSLAVPVADMSWLAIISVVHDVNIDEVGITLIFKIMYFLMISICFYEYQGFSDVLYRCFAYRLIAYRVK